jgi:hypothetical protein
VTRQLRRDPFGRRTLMRDTATPPPGETCAWCGSLSGGRRLFNYWWQPDGYLHTWPMRGHHALALKSFCCLGCFESYNS